VPDVDTSARPEGRHVGVAMGVLVVHGLALLALLQSRAIAFHPESVTTVSLIEMPRKADPPARAKTLELAPVRTRLVFEAMSLPDVVEVRDPSSLPVAAAANAVNAPTAAAGPLALTDELAVFCPSRTAPAYPALSRRHREQGEVTLRVELDAHGQVSDVRVERSSGFGRLDEAARTAVLSWRCQPAVRSGQPTAAVAIQSLEFKLERR
jgi:periplasmic protein TonB